MEGTEKKTQWASSHVIALVVTAVVAFGGGYLAHGASASSAAGSTGGRPDLAKMQNMSPEERRAFFQQNGGAGGSRGGAGGARAGGFRAGGATMGHVLSIGDGTITVGMDDGGSKIVIVADDTSVMRAQDVGLDGLSEGDNVMVMGDANADGTVVAKTITVRSEGIAPGGPGAGAPAPDGTAPVQGQ